MFAKRIKFLIFDIFLVSVSFLFMAWLKPGTRLVVLPQYHVPFFIFLLIWIIISLMIDKYSMFKKSSLSEILFPVIRGNFTILAFLTIIMYAMSIFNFSRLIFFGTILFTSALEIFFGFILYLHRKLLDTSDNFSTITYRASYIEPIALHEERTSNVTETIPGQVADPILTDLKNRYLVDKISLFDFISSHLPLQCISRQQALILDTSTSYNISNFEPESQYLFLNLHKVNDFRRINKFLIQINRNLKYGGFYVGCAETIAENYRKIFNSGPYPLSVLIYLFDFIYRRIFPKLPIFKEIYFALTRGMNRAISKAETLGRLFFCGFKILDVTEIDNKLYFIAEKRALPKTDIDPSYGPIIKMKRVGKDKRIIHIYKFRTMHPYSEYLQGYIHQHHDLDDTGKFKDDFRITGWGRLFRKLWIDELPQLINLLRGDLSLVGVRALSEQYFSLYPPDMQELRTQYKPGLVPPYYADMPCNFDEILDSERRYLEKCQSGKFFTDVSYFFRAFWNIVFKHARSC